MNSTTRHYFDWAATALPCPVYSEAVAPFGNPSSRHSEGRAAKEALEDARRRCAAVLGVKPETLYFTGGGTEANCIALYANLLRPGTGRIIASAAEHPSVSENIKTLQRLGKSVGSIPVDSDGRCTPELLTKTLAQYGDVPSRGEVRFAAIMAVNNEVGAINDIAALRETLDKQSAPIHLHCDMVQAVGKVPFDLNLCDSASLSAHKIGGPRGIGLLYAKKPLEVLYSGGGQESKMRPGTENTAGAVAFAACLEKYAISETVTAELAFARSRMNSLIAALAKMERCVLIPGCRSNEEIENASNNGCSFSPYILQVGFKNIPGEVMVRALDDMGFAVSTGSACSSASPVRPVLAAMGVDEATMRSGIRISQGWSTTDAEIDLLIEALTEALKTL